MSPTETMTRGAPPGGADGDVPEHDVPDRDLLEAAGDAVVVENRSRAGRWDLVSRFHANRVAEVEAAGKGGFFVLTPLQATLAEFAPLFSIAEFSVQVNLDLADGLKEWLPRLWAHCLSGRLDMGRAQIFYDQLANLTSDADKRAYAELVQDWYDGVDRPDSKTFPVGRSTIQRAVRRRCLKFPQRDEQESFAEAFRKRRVSFRHDDNGMALMSAGTSAHTAQLVDYRLTLIAKKLKQLEGEERTIEQLRVDALVDLIQGRLAVGATDADLEQDETASGEDPVTTFERRESVGRFARPVVNVTVSMETLMGLSDEPGELAGGRLIPAELAREIALSPGSTWHRLLTDPVGRFVELSTQRYTPTEPIWLWVVARDHVCTWPGCQRPSTECELDHRVAAPDGATCTCNLHPLCRRHHVFKHSEGVTVISNEDGSTTWTTRFGSTFHSPPPEYPGARPGGAATRRDPAAGEDDREFWSLMEQQFARLVERWEA